MLKQFIVYLKSKFTGHSSFLFVLSCIWNVASATEDVIFKFCLIIIKFSHINLVATILDGVLKKIPDLVILVTPRQSHFPS